MKGYELAFLGTDGNPRKRSVTIPARCDWIVGWTRFISHEQERKAIDAAATGRYIRHDGGLAELIGLIRNRCK